MPAVVADTHAAIWYVTEPGRLSAAAVQALDQASAGGDPIYVASIALVEMRYLVDKGRLSLVAWTQINNVLDAPNPTLVLVPLGIDIARAVAQVPRNLVPDMPDRIMAATALFLNLPLVTRDRKIQSAGITTIW